MRFKRPGKILILIFILSGLLIPAVPAGATLETSTLKSLKEAENLTLSQERVLACNVLIRGQKKATSKEDSKVLKEKLLSLAHFFYTETGQHSFLDGKELFEKKKYSDSVDKFVEADEAEKGNGEVLHFLAMSYLKLQKPKLADATNKRALQLNPYDIDLLRDELSVLVAQEQWAEALKAAEKLIKEYADSTPQTLEDKGVALLKLGQKQEAKKTLEQAMQKNPKNVELYYLLGSLEEKQAASNLMAKYLDFCKPKSAPGSEVDPGTCSHVKEAERLVSNEK